MRGFITGIIFGVGGFWLFDQWQKGRFGLFQFQADEIAAEIGALKAQGQLDSAGLQRVAELMRKLSDAGYKFVEINGIAKAEKIKGDVVIAQDPDMSQEEANVLASRAYVLLHEFMSDSIPPDRGRKFINAEVESEFYAIMERLAEGNYIYTEGIDGAIAEKMPDVPKDQMATMVWEKATAIANVIAKKQGEMTQKALSPNALAGYKKGIEKLIGQLTENGYRYIRTGKNSGKVEQGNG